MEEENKIGYVPDSFAQDFTEKPAEEANCAWMTVSQFY